MQKGSGLVNVGSASSATAVMVNGDTIFTIAGGPIYILSLQSVCVTVNNTTASTLQYQSVPTLGSAATISGASTTLAAAATGVGAVVSLNGAALVTAPEVIAGTAGGVSMAGAGVVVQAGTIKIVIGVGSTTGTWRHFMSYFPLASGVTVS